MHFGTCINKTITFHIFFLSFISFHLQKFVWTGRQSEVWHTKWNFIQQWIKINILFPKIESADTFFFFYMFLAVEWYRNMSKCIQVRSAEQRRQTHHKISVTQCGKFSLFWCSSVELESVPMCLTKDKRFMSMQCRLLPYVAQETTTRCQTILWRI